MNIKKALEAEHSKKQSFLIRDYIGKDKKKFATLMKLFFGPNTILNQRAAWTVFHCFENNNQIIFPYLEKMILNLEKPVHVAVKRNTVKVLEDLKIPEELLGLAANNCFNLLANSNEGIAVRAVSMTVLYNICKREPELKNELKALIETELEQPNPAKAIISRGRKILRML